MSEKEYKEMITFKRTLGEKDIKFSETDISSLALNFIRDRAYYLKAKLYDYNEFYCDDRDYNKKILAREHIWILKNIETLINNYESCNCIAADILKANGISLEYLDEVAIFDFYLYAYKYSFKNLRYIREIVAPDVFNVDGEMDSTTKNTELDKICLKYNSEANEKFNSNKIAFSFIYEMTRILSSTYSFYEDVLNILDELNRIAFFDGSEEWE